MQLADAILSESSIKTFEIINHVEIHGKAIAVTSDLEELNIENSAMLTFHPQALVTSMTESQLVSVNVINSAKS